MLIRSLSFFCRILLVGSNMYPVSTEKGILVSFWLDFSFISAIVIKQPFTQLNHRSSQPKLDP
ncbi:unnamed protein product [Brassica oleracea var. botrytis]